MQIHHNLTTAISHVREEFLKNGQVVIGRRWQGIEQPYPMFEALNVSFSAQMSWYKEQWIEQIKPNLPWADIHFYERIGGQPLNPGQSYLVWPHYPKGNDSHIRSEVFTHTYMERYWPKQARIGGDAELRIWGDKEVNGEQYQERFGIRFHYGDLNDLVDLLKREPDTRQAFLPVWFPEDTGVVHRGRVPCTIGYHFIMREGALNVVYYIRACDWIRHFRDDVYLTIKLTDWIRAQMQDIVMGTFTMHITSLHVFEKERKII